ncbi:MAG TPA: helicase-associated domain-containing protein [Isosphaeraceae bacterium]|jgi:hypothetical protein|nr:helicase-associated domain-containing protein [Isosphaeraceae bacterium]
MGYGIWGWKGPGAVKEPQAPHERSFRRDRLPAWDAKWQGLGPGARRAFLDEVKGPAKPDSQAQPNIAVDKIPKHALDELVAASFVEVRPGNAKSKAPRVFAAPATLDFAARMRNLRRGRVLTGGGTDDLVRFCKYIFTSPGLTDVLHDVLERAKVPLPYRDEEAIALFVANHRWPAWATGDLKDPLVPKVLDALKGPDRLVEPEGLADRVGATVEEVRATLDALIARLVVFEDLRPESLELVVGLLPAVVEGLERKDRPRERPALVPSTPRDHGPEGGWFVADLRAFLLEVAAEPPKIRQDGAIFAKDVDRFLGVFTPFPDWLESFTKRSADDRLDDALLFAQGLKLVKVVPEAARPRLHLNDAGKAWLSGGLDRQYATLYDFLRGPAAGRRPGSSSFGDFDDIDVFDGFGVSYYGATDRLFLGVDLVALKAAKKGWSPYYFDARPEDRKALREAIDRAFQSLPMGEFVKLEGALERLASGPSNPLRLGGEPEQVRVIFQSRQVPALEEQLEVAAKVALRSILATRLIPLGCFRVGLDEAGDAVVARHPRYDAYFGRKVAAEDLVGAPTGAAKVVVQPDFSVVVIGPDPAPAAELAPFCERPKGLAGQGALIFKITRESVLKAVANGLPPEQIARRLERHATTAVPANVLKEVETWGGWVRRVTPATLTVLRCPDRGAADRVVAALGKQVERISDTLVSIPETTISAAHRTKLLNLGIVVDAPAGKSKARANTTKKHRRW